jgi:hypothetical protein
MRKREVILATLAILCLLFLVPDARAYRIGKNPGDVKGRWLEVKDDVILSAYDGVYIGEVTAEVHWKKKDRETPVDEEILKDTLRTQLLTSLREARTFERVSGEQPSVEELEQAKWLRLDCDLVVEAGSRALRYWVGFGAGKSKSILTIRMKGGGDEDLGHYHGFGSGSGAVKLAGGGAVKMTKDDTQENMKQFARLLAQQRRLGK